MGLVDIVDRVPKKTDEISDYILDKHDNVREMVEKNPEYAGRLKQVIDSSIAEYSKYLGGMSSKIGSLGRGVGYTADAWLLGTQDIVGSLGGKFLNLLAQVPEKSYGLLYGVQTGNYLDSARNILEGMVSFLPGFTFVDEGLERIIRKRIIKDSVSKFEKELGIEKHWTEGIKDRISGSYKDVKDRRANVFTPAYSS